MADQAVALGVTYVNHTFTSGLGLAASVVPFAGIEDYVICEYPVESRSLAQDRVASSEYRVRCKGQSQSLSQIPRIGL